MMGADSEESSPAARAREARNYAWGDAEPTPERANLGGEERLPDEKRYRTWNFARRKGWNDGFPTTAKSEQARP